MHLEDMLISLYVLVDEWWWQSHPPVARKPSRAPSLWPSEVLTLAVLAQWPRWRSERDFFRFVDAHLRPYFPNLASHGQLNRRIRALEPELKAFQRDLAATLVDGSEVYRIPEYHPHTSRREGPCLPQGLVCRAGDFRPLRLQNRVGLRFQGGALGDP